MAPSPAARPAQPRRPRPGIRPATTARSRSISPTRSTKTRSNEPIGDNCYFWLKFYNFDAGQQADITFAAHPPTGGKARSSTRRRAHQLTTRPAAVTDEDEIIAYNLTDYVSGLNPHPQHGYHIKLTTTIKDAQGNQVPGGVKHKVFWIKCTPPPAEETPQTQAASTLRIAKAQEGTGEGPFAFELNCTHAPLNRTFTLKAGEKLDITDVPARHHVRRLGDRRQGRTGHRPSPRTRCSARRTTAP